MANKHAVLSASSSDRWLHCPPSARLCEDYEDTYSSYAAEGTAAHSLCEFRLKEHLGLPCENPTENLSWYNKEMEDCAGEYANFVYELVEEMKHTCNNPIVLIEQRVDFSRWVEEGFGTADCIVIADNTMHIVDYKHGQGVEVSAVNNPQMMLYALGASELFDCLYDISVVRMSIFQPRKNNISTFELTKDALYQWAETELISKATLAFEGKGEFCSGEWCRFCKAKAECRERARANMDLAKYEFRSPHLLTDKEVSEILAKVDLFTAWINDIKDYALKEAVAGKDWPDWKLVEGRSTRKYIDEDVVAAIVEKAGFNPYEKKLLGISAMQKLLGKTRFEELLNPYIEKPQGKPTLVPFSDHRPMFKNAKIEFTEE